MRILMVGGGSNQIIPIKRIKEMGFEVVVSDYNETSPGKKFADYPVKADAFSVEETLEAAKKYNVDGIMTSGTDQPVYIVSKVAEALNLNTFINSKVAKNVTNKKYMKKIFYENKIKTAKYMIIDKNVNKNDFLKFKFPVVLKPLDSQGQRGIFKLDSYEDIVKKLDETLSFSRENEAIVEEYYESDEITISGWVNNGELKILTITDRVTFEDKDKIGICVSHEFPSIHFKEHGKEIIEISEKITNLFQITNGPIYYQFLIGNEGIFVNEIACRIGGAYEDIFIKMITGVDILEKVILGSIGNDSEDLNFQKYNLYENKNFLSVQLFFAEQGKIEKLEFDKNMIDDGIVEAFGYNFKVGDEIGKIVNATQRAGFFIVKGSNESEIINKINKGYDLIKIIDDKGKNLIIRGRRGKNDK